MPRPSTGANLSIAQLQQIIGERKYQLTRLNKERKSLLKDLTRVERDIARIGGSGGGRRGVRARNEKSLPEVLDEVLRASGKPMKIGDITEAVQSAGYRSSSPNFRSIVNQTLIKERKRFVPSGVRGMYQIKK